MLTIDWFYQAELTEPIVRQRVRGALYTGDDRAHRVTVAALRAGEAIDLTGQVITGYFLRASGETVLISGEVVQGQAAVLLPAACYEVPGAFSLVIRAASDEAKVTLLALTGMVRASATDAVVDPAEVIPSLDELLTRIAAMEEATGAARDAADHAEAIYGTVRTALEKGELTGRGLTILGYHATAEALRAAVTSPRPGDAYGVGASAPYDIFVWDGAALRWVNNGPLQGHGLPLGGEANQVLAKASATDMDTVWKSVVDLVYPVGSIYMSMAEASPAALFGGRWEAIEDRFLLASGAIARAGATGGARTHTLTQAELPALSLSIPGEPELSSPAWAEPNQAVIYRYMSGTPQGNVIVSLGGSGAAFSTMPPYLAVHMWQRVA